MYACAELFCVLTNVSNKFVFGRFPLRGALAPSAPPLRAPLIQNTSFDKQKTLKYVYPKSLLSLQYGYYYNWVKRPR